MLLSNSASMSRCSLYTIAVSDSTLVEPAREDRQNWRSKTRWIKLDEVLDPGRKTLTDNSFDIVLVLLESTVKTFESRPSTSFLKLVRPGGWLMAKVSPENGIFEYD